MESTETQLTLRELITGTRLLVRSKTDWRNAVISSANGEIVTLIVCSPSGRTYRLRRKLECEIVFDGKIPFIKCDIEENWRENFSKYDTRW